MVAYRNPDLLPAQAPGRFSVRARQVGPLPALTPSGLVRSRAAWWVELVDERTESVGWVIVDDLPYGERLAVESAQSLAAAPLPNPGCEEKGERGHVVLEFGKLPYWEPDWPTKSELAKKARSTQSMWNRARQLFAKEIPKRGRWLEDQAWVEKLRDRDALFAVSHSGGKDSQAQLVLLRKVVPDDQIIVVHAPLRYVEWEGAQANARNQTPPGSDFLLAHAWDETGQRKWLLQWVLERKKWPDINQRWCTSDFKTHVIERDLRRYLKEHRRNLVVECVGQRAEESRKRMVVPVVEHKADLGIPKNDNKPGHVRGDSQPMTEEEWRHGRKRREWYKYHPIKWLPTGAVFDVIRKAGLEPLWTYSEGMSRASCAFCVLSSKPDLAQAAKMAPELYAAYVAVENIVNDFNQEHVYVKHEGRQGGTWVPGDGAPHLIKQGQPLEDFTGIPADPRLVKRFRKTIEGSEDGIWNLPLPDEVPQPRSSGPKVVGGGTEEQARRMLTRQYRAKRLVGQMMLYPEDAG